jgi:hypothetical protein
VSVAAVTVETSYRSVLTIEASRPKDDHVDAVSTTGFTPIEHDSLFVSLAAKSGTLKIRDFASINPLGSHPSSASAVLPRSDITVKTGRPL